MLKGTFVCVLSVVLFGVLSMPTRPTWVSLVPSKKVAGVSDVWTDCSHSGDGAKILSITLSPDPPQKNEPLTINATVQVFEIVNDGTVMVNASYNGFEIFEDDFDLCFLLSQIQMQCPVEPGKYSGGGTVTVPGDLPTGHYTGYGVAVDPNGKELGCIELNLTF